MEFNIHSKTRKDLTQFKLICALYSTGLAVNKQSRKVPCTGFCSKATKPHTPTMWFKLIFPSGTVYITVDWELRDHKVVETIQCSSRGCVALQGCFPWFLHSIARFNVQFFLLLRKFGKGNILWGNVLVWYASSCIFSTCVLSTHTQTHTHTHARAHTHAHVARTHTHTHTHTHTPTHTHIPWCSAHHTSFDFDVTFLSMFYLIGFYSSALMYC